MRFLTFIVQATCKASGDPHYTTFDGSKYDFMGKCEYVLAKDSMNNSFEIRQVNEACNGGQVSCTKSLSVIFPELVIYLGRGSVMVNGSTVNFPYNYGGRIVRTYVVAGKYLTITVFGFCKNEVL